MSIRQVQIKHILELVSQAFFVNGINPLTTQVNKYMTSYFAKNKPGQPLTFDPNILKDIGPFNFEALNDFMAISVVNLDTVYEASIQHVDQIMMLNTILRTHLERLRIKRRILEDRVDDYLFGIFNSDGYFYSFSDNLLNRETINFSLSSCFIDFSSGIATLPSLSSYSKKLDLDRFSTPQITVLDSDDKKLDYQEEMSFDHAIDGLTNTAWQIKVVTETIRPITAYVNFQIGRLNNTSVINKIDITPFGVTPVSCLIVGEFYNSETPIVYAKPFSRSIKVSNDKMTFIADDTDQQTNAIEFRLTKTEPDYKFNEGNKQYNVYIFGIKEIVMMEQAFDQSATFISEPISIDPILGEEKIIDAVSLVVDQVVPRGTSISYYVAADNDIVSGLSSFDWKSISPVQKTDIENSVVKFGASTTTFKMIRNTIRNNSDINLIPLDNTNNTLALRNPTPAYMSGSDIYRVCSFDDDFLSGTLKLEEGINTTKIYYTDYDVRGYTDSMVFWREKFDEPSSYLVSYGEIDTGNDFFYGADIGENFKSIYIETFVYSEKQIPIFLKECKKTDINSRTWSVRVFLNGKEIADMPVGTDSLTIPWKIEEGKNNIVVIVNIPDSTDEAPLPYIGTFSLMDKANVFDYGVVKLSDWTYVDFNEFKYNQVNDPKSFTIYNKEIISRRKPTNNFRISYKKSNGLGPKAIRLRADFNRSEYNPKATPMLDSYRVRFSYS